VVDSRVAIIYSKAWQAAKRYTKRHHDQEDAAQQGMLHAIILLARPEIPEEKRTAYACMKARWGVIEYVRYALLFRKKIKPVFEDMPKDLPCEKWRQDLKVIEAKLDWQALERKLQIYELLGYAAMTKRKIQSKIEAKVNHEELAKIPRWVDAQKALIERALAAAGGSVTLAAKQLGIGRSSIFRMLREHRVEFTPPPAPRSEPSATAAAPA